MKDNIEKRPYFCVGKWEYCDELDENFFIPLKNSHFYFEEELAGKELKKEQEKEPDCILQEFVYYEPLKCSIPRKLYDKAMEDGGLK